MQLLLSARVCVSNLELLPQRLATYYHNNLGWVSGRCLLLCVQKVNIPPTWVILLPFGLYFSLLFFFLNFFPEWKTHFLDYCVAVATPAGVCSIRDELFFSSGAAMTSECLMTF